MCVRLETTGRSSLVVYPGMYIRPLILLSSTESLKLSLPSRAFAHILFHVRLANPLAPSGAAHARAYG